MATLIDYRVFSSNSGISAFLAFVIEDDLNGNFIIKIVADPLTDYRLIVAASLIFKSLKCLGFGVVGLNTAKVTV